MTSIKLRLRLSHEDFKFKEVGSKGNVGQSAKLTNSLTYGKHEKSPRKFNVNLILSWRKSQRVLDFLNKEENKHGKMMENPRRKS